MQASHYNKLLRCQEDFPSVMAKALRVQEDSVLMMSSICTSILNSDSQPES